MTRKITDYDAPVPVKPRSGRAPSALTQSLSDAIDVIATTGHNQQYSAGDRREAERVSVRLRQLAAKVHLPLSVAITDANVVVFGPRQKRNGNGNGANGDNHDGLDEIKTQLRELLDKLESVG